MQIIVLSPRTKLVNYAHTYRKRESYNLALATRLYDTISALYKISFGALTPIFDDPTTSPKARP